jgi:hypothetical protein
MYKLIKFRDDAKWGIISLNTETREVHESPPAVRFIRQESIPYREGGSTLSAIVSDVPADTILRVMDGGVNYVFLHLSVMWRIVAIKKLYPRILKIDAVSVASIEDLIELLPH